MKTWHVECLGCHARFRHDETVVQVFNAGYDWEDSESYCPSCGKALQDSPGYTMHDGPVPGRAVAMSAARQGKVWGDR